jgi:DNA repair exonuclease SbcCD ATPase subunit
MDEFQYSRTLTRCMIVSALALLAGVFLPIHHLVPFAAALAPLVYYHVWFLRPQAENGLSQAAIDSVYYYGFLITVGALGATALSLSLNGFGDDFSAVAFQFGLGLLATGYAVWARVHLVGIAKQLDEDDLRDLMALQIAKSRELLSNLELASSSFQSFAETLIAKTSDFSSSIQQQTESSISQATKTFGEGISALTEQAQVALQELRGIVNDVTFGAEREQLKTSVTATVETVNALSNGLNDLTKSTGVGASSAEKFASSLSSVNESAAGAASELSKLGKKDGIVAEFGSAVTAGKTSLSEMATIASEASRSIKGINDSASPVENELKALSKALVKANEASQTATNMLSALQSLGSQSGAATSELSSLKSKMSELQETLVNLNDGLIDSTGRLKDAMSEASDHLENIHAPIAAE